MERLLAEFGTAADAIWGSAARLQRAGLDRDAVERLGKVRAAILHVLRQPLLSRPILSDWKALLDYLRAEMAFLTVEQVRVLHLDTRNVLIRDEVVSEGTIDQACVHVREVIRRALELGSAGIVMVHNHPTGDPEPSRADVDVTRALASAGKSLGIVVHDHLIVGRLGHVSLQARGLLA